MSSGFNRPIGLLMMAIAVILAAGVFLAINVVRNRNNAEEIPQGNFLITVGAEQVSLLVDPNTRPQIIDDRVSEDTPRPEGAPDEQVVIETANTPEATAVPTDVPPATAVPATAVPKIIRVEYVVQAGDTLYSIAANRIDTNIALMAEYDIAQGNIVPGQTILLPVGNPAFCTGKGRPYAVKEGDTAFSISQRFNTTATNLQSLNGLDASYTVKVADIICVP